MSPENKRPGMRDFVELLDGGVVRVEALVGGVEFYQREPYYIVRTDSAVPGSEVVRVIRCPRMDGYACTGWEEVEVG